MAAKDIILEARNITKIYRRGNEEVHALNGISLDVERGEYIAFIGPSGSGKTTLVNILGCLDNPTSGTLRVGNREIFRPGKELSEGELTRIRRATYGYIFQNFYLVPTLTVEENVSLPWSFYRNEGGNAGLQVPELLKSLGIEKRAGHLPGQLSGGEMQRAAIARALVNGPQIILADEPTGNLDSGRSREIGRLLKELNRSSGLTVILVTHNEELAKTAGRIVEIRDGLVSPKKRTVARR